MTRWLSVTVLTVLLSASAGAVKAQQLGAQRFHPAGSEDGILGVEGAERRRPRFPYVSLGANYALNPVVLSDDGDDRSLINHALAADLVASIAVWKGLEFGFHLPVTLVSRGDDALAQGLGAGGVDGAGLGDISLRAAYRWQLSYRDALAVHLPFLLPSAREGDLLALGWGVRPTLAYTHGFDRADLTLNTSYLYREDEQLLDYRGGQELGLRVGVRVGLTDTWDTALLASLGVDTAIRDFFGAAETPVEPRVGVEHWFGRHFRLTGFLGTGLSRGVGAPDFRTGASVAYGEKPPRPRREGDRDSDGVLDVDDRCPDEPEDVDGFQDRDGCPDPDNDQDGILDEDDACPLEPETHDGIADDDGCPDRVRVKGSLITTFERVHFETNSARIKQQSYPLLREVASVIRANPDMEIHVAGHADSRGDEDYNRDLSERRAQSVRDFLVAQNIDEDRVDSAGYGEDQPVANNKSRKGRQENRRVEFHIKDRR